jgi:DNA-binding MarR family transcriptional regulator
MSPAKPATARDFIDLFPAVFLNLHRRAPKRSPLTQQGLAVLQHLALAGPLTVTEAARHMDRAQSVMSGILAQLERKGLVEHMRDERDRRRTLVWLTPAGFETLERERQVLSLERTEQAFARMSPQARKGLVDGMRALVRAAEAGRGDDR